jgi:hypothetical protein
VTRAVFLFVEVLALFTTADLHATDATFLALVAHARVGDEESALTLEARVLV